MADTSANENRCITVTFSFIRLPPRSQQEEEDTTFTSFCQRGLIQRYIFRMPGLSIQIILMQLELLLNLRII